MALGRRRHRSERQKIDATPPWATDRERDTEVTTGPYDQQDAPDDGLERLDLGALLVPVIRGVEVRVDVGPDGQVIAATLSYGGSEAQIGVFAAPRTAGIWDDVRKEIRASIVQQGGTAQDGTGRFGTELTGRIPVQGGYQSVRFVGVDGPRWFLRGLFSGPAAADPAKAAGARGHGAQHRRGARRVADAGAGPAAADPAAGHQGADRAGPGGGRGRRRPGRRRAGRDELDEDEPADLDEPDEEEAVPARPNPRRRRR
jgi:hypothetical protein